MKIKQGNIILLFGLMHSILGISPFAFGKQFSGFASHFFFKISEGLIEFPLLKGEMNFENFAAFWFVYYGLLLIPLGIIVNFVESKNHPLPKSFVWSYLIIVLIGVYMIPFSGMTFLMLPQAIFLCYKYYYPS